MDLGLARFMANAMEVASPLQRSYSSISSFKYGRKHKAGSRNMFANRGSKPQKGKRRGKAMSMTRPMMSCRGRPTRT